jgi:hypothetical protein
MAESVDEVGESKQVGQGAQACPLSIRTDRDARSRWQVVRPGRGNQRPALVWQDQQEVEFAVPMRVVQDLKSKAFKGMALANNGD